MLSNFRDQGIFSVDNLNIPVISAEPVFSSMCCVLVVLFGHLIRFGASSCSRYAFLLPMNSKC